MIKKNKNLKESAKQVNNVKVEEVESKKISAKDILSTLQKNTNGLLKTSLGTKKATIYKEDIFSECSDKEKKSLRKKLRNTLFSICSSIISEIEEEKQNKLIKIFNDFYKSIYVINDYSLQSICNENLKTEKKDILQQALNICKKIN